MARLITGALGRFRQILGILPDLKMGVPIGRLGKTRFLSRVSHHQFNTPSRQQ